jgi:molybdenum cofactor biosynthesis enzyme MoaA
MLETLVLSVMCQCSIQCWYCGANGGLHHTERMSLVAAVEYNLIP